LNAGINQLATITEDAPGWTRRVFSEPDRAGRELVAAMMRDAGMVVQIDAAGNVVGRLEGERPGLPAIVTGSHTDTVLGGGRFDGVVGVLGAIEAVRLIGESGVRLSHDLVVVDFFGEEANDHGLSYVGSRALTNTLTATDLARTDRSGRTLAAAIETCGGDPSAALALGWSRRDVHAYFELHVEQGPFLDEHACPIGLVTTIVGIRRFVSEVVGRTDHAGTTPMGKRHDAGLAAAEIALLVEEIATSRVVNAHPSAAGSARGSTELFDAEMVATVGDISLWPAASNVVPGRAQLVGEVRSPSAALLDRFAEALTGASIDIADRRAVQIGVEWPSVDVPTPMNAQAMHCVRAAASERGLQVMELASFAGHDAVEMAALGPAAMVFIPSVGGRSHCPEEWTELGDVAAGTDTLARALVLADGEMPVS